VGMLVAMARPRECPVCHKPLPVLDADAPYRPFCSERCKSIDLGSWLDGRYRISRQVEEEDLDSGISPDEDA
jgi:endogenous inhibitor of DNA gyrase (YacG/DUF329 family)